jgi:uncharacterized peroxidase-related enzyme
MSYIKVPDESDDLDQATREVFERAEERFGFVPDVVRTLAVRPDVALAQTQLRESLMGDSCSLGRRRADLIALAVSGINDCEYCGTAHAGMLVERGEMSREEAAIAFKDWRALELDQGDAAMLEFAEKLTFQPAEIDAADIERLRTAGFDDRGIYEIVLLAAYRNFINRVNDGLGVPTEKLQVRFGDSPIAEVKAERRSES